MKRHGRVIFLLAFAVLVLGVLGFKASQQKWFVPRPYMELNGQPALLFFTLSEGCDCQMRVIRHAATQVAFWKPVEHLKINIISIDFDERPDLARYFHVDRAPALVLLDHNGEVFWMQDEPQSDDLPFDMSAVEEQIASLLASEGR
jgi:hypothetical protein